MIPYEQFLAKKMKLAEPAGFQFDDTDLFPDWIKGHQKALVTWALHGGRRGLFTSFGTGKTIMQLLIGKATEKHTGLSFLIVAPLGAIAEFKKDAAKLGLQVVYVTNMEEVRLAEDAGISIILTNYERVRMGSFDPSHFGGVSLDEAAEIRNLDSKITDYVLESLSVIQYRWVCTATPSPNNYIELLNYAEFLGIMDRGQALTRYFERDSTKAGNLTLYPHREDDFWIWVRSWAIFLTKPSTLGFSDEGYDLPELDISLHVVSEIERGTIKDRSGNATLLANQTGGLPDAAREKRVSIAARVNKAIELIKAEPDEHCILWHHLEDEREEMQQQMPAINMVYGSQNHEEREQIMADFADGKIPHMGNKPEIAGAGRNFQYHCHWAIYVGINDKFHDFIQSIHRLLRYGQKHKVRIDIIYTDAEERTLQNLFAKWKRHNESMKVMEALVKKYGLSDAALIDAHRSVGVPRKVLIGKYFKSYRNDNVLELRDTPSNSVHLDISSWPFGDQYEYSESLHDMGHNYGNQEFLAHMDYLTPELFRTLIPGRMSCVHIKDRIRYSYQNKYGFTTLEDFSGDCIRHMQKHGFAYMGRITVTTDVVQENNQTYRLTHAEMVKDATKMGVGLPEYILIFRKPPTDVSKNSYGDIPVVSTKEASPLANWQIDAHSHWASNGETISQMTLKQLYTKWKLHALTHTYDYDEHVSICKQLESVGRLPKKYMIAPPYTHNPYVWNDISRMRTLNADQVRNGREKHLCPLQTDIVKRLIKWYSMKGEIVRDYFGGIGTVSACSIELEREGVTIELNENYWKDGNGYQQDAERKRIIPSLLQMVKYEEVA